MGPPLFLNEVGCCLLRLKKCRFAGQMMVMLVPPVSACIADREHIAQINITWLFRTSDQCLDGGMYLPSEQRKNWTEEPLFHPANAAFTDMEWSCVILLPSIASVVLPQEWSAPGLSHVEDI